MAKTQIEILKKIGFQKIGCWYKNGNNSGVSFEIKTSYRDTKKKLYCFESGGKAYYFGITNTSINDRMTNYKSGKKENKSGSTNKYVYERIKKLPEEEKPVNIYVLQPTKEIDYHGYNIDLHKGLEFSLIEAFDHEDIWNNQGSKYPNKKATNNIAGIQNENSTVTIHKGKEFKKGVISFPKSYHHLLPDESCDVNLKIGDSNFFIRCRFTNSGNNRKINGKSDVIKWYDENRDDGNIVV